MRVLFATSYPYLPQAFSGATVSTNALAVSLRERGFQVEVLAGLRDGDWPWFRNRVVSKLRGKNVHTMNKFYGYPVFRGWGSDGIPDVVENFKPDIVLLQTCPLRAYADHFLNLGLPVIICLRDATFYGGSLIEHPSLRYIANSGFIAGKLRTDYGIESEVISPLVLPENCRTHTTRENVLFVNPVEDKGVEIALRLAEERPDIPFDFVECWQQSSKFRDSVRVLRANNIHWHKPQLDASAIYRRARLLLMPSQWEEAWGRCATEAQLNRIPVLASRIGGLPESVGTGGILVEARAPIEDWLAALSKMWDDKQQYELLAQEALKYSQRPEIQPELLVDRVEQAIREHAGNRPRIAPTQKKCSLSETKSSAANSGLAQGAYSVNHIPLPPSGSPQRIAIISDLAGWSWAGCEELWAATARKALQDGHKVAFFKSRDEIAPGKIMPLTALGLKLILPGRGAGMAAWLRKRVSYRLGNLAAPWFPPSFGIRDFAPDVILLNVGDALPRPEFVNDLERSGTLRIPYVVLCHNSFLFEKPIVRQTQKIAAHAYQRARRVLFVATRTYKETEHLLAARLSHVTIVRNPVNVNDASPLPMPSGATVRIASLGRLAINSKGQDILLAALGSPQFKNRDWQLSIYGEGPHLPQLKLFAKHYQIENKVVFKGYAEDLRAVWAENHLLALPSRNESAPLVLVEAMLCGRPSVSNNVGGITEWISEPETGFISEGIDIDSFQSALERAWAARPQWEAIGQRAREKALGMIDPDPGGTVLNILLEVAAENRCGIRTERENINYA
jgi:glycosyltransferase involved in cell wall biosynthesis